jgi:hypothetical protein
MAVGEDGVDFVGAGAVKPGAKPGRKGDMRLIVFNPPVPCDPPLALV